jgi:hypothetical protein
MTKASYAMSLSALHQHAAAIAMSLFIITEYQEFQNNNSPRKIPASLQECMKRAHMLAMECTGIQSHAQLLYPRTETRDIPWETPDIIAELEMAANVLVKSIPKSIYGASIVDSLYRCILWFNRVE